MDATTIQANPAGAFDLAQYEARDSASLTVQNKAGTGPLLGTDGLPVTIELYGPGSEVYLKVTTDIDRANTDRMLKSIGKGVSNDNFVDQRATTAKKLAACTKAVSQNFPVAPEALYGNPRLGYITSQAARFLEDWANF